MGIQKSALRPALWGLVLLIPMLFFQNFDFANRPASRLVFFPFEYPAHHQVGKPRGVGWYAETCSGGFLTFGPGISLQTGLYRAQFKLVLGSDVSPETFVGQVDISSSTPSGLVNNSIKYIYARDFTASNEPQIFELDFWVPPSGYDAWQFRVFCTNGVALEHTSTVLDRFNTGSELYGPVQPTLASFFMGQAYFERMLTQEVHTGRSDLNPDALAPAHNNVANTIIPLDRKWYMFSRENNWEASAGPTAIADKEACTYIDPKTKATVYLEHSRLVVRESWDQGKTWSAPFTIFSPEMGTATECGVMDGTPIFDPGQQQWHYIGQCLNRALEWRICHHYGAPNNRHPFQLFTTNPFSTYGKGAILNRSQVGWDYCQGLARLGRTDSRVCPYNFTTNGADGTVEYLGRRRHKDRSYFYITVHSTRQTSDGTTPDGRGWRFALRTDDLSQPASYQIIDDTDPVLKQNPIMGQQECTSLDLPWSGEPVQGSSTPCIGVGSAGMLKEGDYYYSVAEFGDYSLMAVPNQLWAFAFFRTRFDVTTSRKSLWERPANPANKTLDLIAKKQSIVMEQVPRQGYVAYQKLFSDETGTYTSLVYIPSLSSRSTFRTFKLKAGSEPNDVTWNQTYDNNLNLYMGLWKGKTMSEKGPGAFVPGSDGKRPFDLQAPVRDYFPVY